VAFTNLLRLALLTGDNAFESRASDLARLYAGVVERTPSAYSFFLSGLCFLFGSSAQIVICEGPGGELAENMTASLHARYLPFITLMLKKPGNKSELEKIAPFTKEMTPVGGKTSAYLCSRHTCSAPVTGANNLIESIDKIAGYGAIPHRKRSDVF
jgi:hypothetical protein